MNEVPDGARPGQTGQAQPLPAPSVPQAGHAPNGLATASLVTGLSAVLGVLVNPFVAPLVGLTAVVLGVVAAASTASRSRGMAVAGAVAGGVAMVGSFAAPFIMGAVIEHPPAPHEAVSAVHSAEATTAVPQGELEDGRADLRHVTCTHLVEDAITFSRTYALGDAALIDVGKVTLETDERTTYSSPDLMEPEPVMSCGGFGTWGDGSREPVLLELSLDRHGDTWVGFVRRSAAG